MRNWTHHVAGAWQNPITSCRRWQKDQTPIQKQTKYRTQQTKHRAQRCLSKKKKKIPNTQTKTKPSNPWTVTSSPQRARRRRRNGHPSSQIDICSQIDIDIVDGRSVIGSSLYRLRLCLCAGERCSSTSWLPPAVRPSLKVFFSNSLSDSQSLSLSLYLTEWLNKLIKNEMKLIN